MAALKKFMFDNFTIDVPKKEHKIVDEVTIDDMAVAEKELAPIIEPVFEKKEAIEIDTKEFDKKLNQAVNEAYQKGFNEGKEASENAVSSLLTSVDTNIRKLLKEDNSKLEETYANNIKEIANLIIEKLVPTLEAKEATNIITRFLQDNFNNFKVEKKLTIHLHPNKVAEISNVIANLAEKNDFEGKISIVKDASLSEVDCKVLWDFGGVSFEQEKNINNVKEIIKS